MEPTPVVVEETKPTVEEKVVEEKKDEPVVDVPKVDEVKDDNQSSNINVIDAEGEKSDIPPLPENPPPSQVMAFVESVIDKPAETIEETIISPAPKIVESLVQESQSLLESVKEDAKVTFEEIPAKVEETVVAAAIETVKEIKEELVEPVADAIEQILEEASDKVSQIEKQQEEEPKSEQIEETIALLDKVNQGVLPSDESSENLEAAAATSPVIVDEVAKVEDDISSLPMPQDSFESLSSPPASNNESQSDNSFPPPPPPETSVELSVPVEETPKVEEPAEDKVILNEHETTSNHVNYHS